MLKMTLKIEGTRGEITGLLRPFSHDQEFHFMWPRPGRHPLFGLARLMSFSHMPASRFDSEETMTIECMAVLRDTPWLR